MSAGVSPLATARDAAGYSQESFADAVGVARETVSRWERGLTRPQTSVRLKIAAALKITLGELDALLSATHQRSGARPPSGSQPTTMPHDDTVMMRPIRLQRTTPFEQPSRHCAACWPASIFRTTGQPARCPSYRPTWQP